MEPGRPSPKNLPGATAGVNPFNRIRVAYALLFALAAFGCLWNLDDRRLWGDEAETALLAANIVETGFPRVSDGRNTISNLPERRDANADGIWTWSPWLDEYLAAASLSVFGSTAWAARLPFAILGLLAVLLLARVAYQSYGSHSVALIATALLATCVPFLLHVRQARYYAIVVFAQVWLLHGVRQSFRQPGWRAALHVALPLAALFYSNYILALAPALAVIVVATWRMRSHPDSFRCLAGAGGLFAALAIPWLLYAAPWNQLGGLGAGSIPENILYYVREANRHVLPLWILAVPLGWLAVVRMRGVPAPGRPIPETQALEVFAVSRLGLSLLVYGLSPFRFFRYLVPLIPVLFLLSSAVLTRAIGSSALRTTLVFGVIAANVLGWEQWIRPPFPAGTTSVRYLDFGRSITRPYDEPLDAAIEFFNDAASPGDRVWVPDPEFPLIFHTQLSVIDARLHPRLPSPPPEWILPVTVSGVSKRKRLRLPPDWSDRYETIELEIPQARPGHSRPDPNFFQPFSAPGVETLTVLRRIDP